MELLRDAEPVVNTAAYFFDEVGLGETASALRSGLPLESLESALIVAGLLQEVHPDERISDLCFWAAGAILSAIDGEIDLFNDCLLMVKRCVESWDGEFSMH